MRIVFMGTPEFATPALAAIALRGHEVRLAVTQRDKARGRGNKLRYTPVKEKAIELGIEVMQPDNFDEGGEAEAKINECLPDLIVSAAYGRLLPANILRIPKHGCVNIHASLLPRWRGAAPVQRAVIEGDAATGVTIMYMAERLDSGDIIMSESTVIEAKTASELYDELAFMGARLIIEAIDKIGAGSVIRKVQDDGLATYAAMISKKDGALDFSDDPVKLERRIRGVNPWPGAYTVFKGETMKVWKATPKDENNSYGPGVITGVSEAGLEVSAGGKTLLITEIQMPGKKRTEIKEFIKGNKIEKFTILG